MYLVTTLLTGYQRDFSVVTDWDAYGYVAASQYREDIILHLSESNNIPSKISEETEFQLSHVSNTLSDLVEKELVVCMNPEKSKGRVYTLTEKGEWVASQL